MWFQTGESWLSRDQRRLLMAGNGMSPPEFAEKAIDRGGRRLRFGWVTKRQHDPTWKDNTDTLFTRGRGWPPPWRRQLPR